MSDHIIIISCSNGKVRGGNTAYNPDDSITAFLPPEIQQTVWERRRTIADWIIAGQVEDRLRGDGNRRDSRYNVDLKMGPDLGAGLSETCPPDTHSDMRQESQSKAPIQYLPAYERYDGRFFVNAGLETFEKAIVEECHVLIVSGLYGLPPPDEIAPRIVNFFSALENELHSICRPKAGKGSLGEFIHRLCQGELKDCWPDKQTCAAMCSELARLLTIRNCMSHRGVVRREGLLKPSEKTKLCQPFFHGGILFFLHYQMIVFGFDNMFFKTGSVVRRAISSLSG